MSTKDIRVLFKGDPSDAVAATKTIEKAGADTAKQLEKDFQTLGAKTTAAFEAKRKAATSAYDRIKASGLASTEELSRVEKAHAARMMQVDEEQYGKRSALMEKEFQELGVKSSAAYEQKRKAAQSAYDGIKNSGVATNDELTRAGAAHAAKMTAIDEEQFGKRTSLLQKFKANWLGATAAIGAAWIAATKGWDLAELAGKGMQQRQSFQNMSASKGLNADAIIADLERVSGETIATQALVEKAGTSMLLGIEGKMLPKLMEISRAASRVTGAAITDSFGDLSLAVGRQSKMILDNLGIILNVEKANEAYAAANHKTVASLTDFDRKQAFLNATLVAGQEIIDAVGVSGMTAMEKMEKLKAELSNIKEVVGRGVLGTMLLFGGALQGVASFALGTAAGIWKMQAAMEDMFGSKEGAAQMRANADASLAVGADLYAKAKEMISGAGDVFMGTLDPVNEKLAAYQQKMAAQKVADAAAAEQKEKLSVATKSAASALSDYSKSIDDLGRQQLQLAESGFSKDLERQEGFFKKSGQAAANLSAPIRSYLGVLDQVYGAQVKAQEAIAAVLGKIGADQAARLQQQVNIANTEKAKAEARLGAWKTYYDKLASLHSAAMETMRAKQEAALEVKKTGAEFKQALDDKFTPAVNLSEYDQLFTGLARADQAFTSALQLTGPQKAAALQSAMDLLKNLPTEVKEGDQIIVSSLEIYDQVIGRFNQMQDARQSLADAEAASAKIAADSIATEMQRAQDAMKLVADEVTALDAKILALNKTITLTMPTDQVNEAARKIQGYLDAIKDKTITITANYVSNIPSSLSGSSSAGGSFSGIGQSLESFSSPTPYHAGTSYVPRSGLYNLARGEEVLNRDEVAKKSRATLPDATATALLNDEASEPLRLLQRSLTLPDIAATARLNDEASNPLRLLQRSLTLPDITATALLNDEASAPLRLLQRSLTLPDITATALLNDQASAPLQLLQRSLTLPDITATALLNDEASAPLRLLQRSLTLPDVTATARLNDQASAPRADIVPRAKVAFFPTAPRERTNTVADFKQTTSNIINLGGIHISGVTAAGAEKTARELAREIEPELRKLAGRYR